MSRWMAALVLLLGSVVSARALEPAIGPYQAAASSGEVGRVTGRVYEERRKPEGPETPFVGAAVTLLPCSGDFLRRLERIKEMARSSANSYRAAAPAVLALRASYEKELWKAGAADLVRATVVGADGRFTVEDLPSGEWVLLVTHSARTERHGRGASSKHRSAHTPGTRLTGYQEVIVWLREIRLASRGTKNVELTERGVWFSGIIEDRVPDTGR